MKLKRLLSFPLAVILLCLCACTPSADNNNLATGGTDASPAATPAASAGANETPVTGEGEPEGYTLPLCEPGSVTLSLATPDNLYAPSSFADNIGIFKILEERTGVTIEWQVYAADYQNSIYPRLASGIDLPDMFSVPGGGSPDMVSKLAAEGIIAPIDEYIYKYAVNIQSTYERFPEMRNGTIHSDGHIYSLAYSVHEQQGLKFPSTFIRQDWLDKLGLTAPKTIDDWYNVLVAFRDGDPNENGKQDEVPLACSALQIRGGAGYGIFGNAWGLRYGGASQGVMARDGKVMYSQILPEFKEYLTWMNKLYSEKLIDQTLLAPVGTLRDENLLGASIDMTGALPGHNAALVSMTGDDTMMYVPVLPPSLDASSPQVLETSNGLLLFFAVSKNCENPDIAVKWLDYFYASEDGRLLTNWGVEGETFTLDAQGQPQLTEYVTNNPNGVDMGMVLRSVGAFNNFLMIRDVNLMKAISKPFEIEFAAQVQDNLVPPFPVMIPTPEESRSVSSIMADITPFESEMITKFIMGTESLDKFDDYVAQMKTLGIDEAIAIWQAQYDRTQ